MKFRVKVDPKIGGAMGERQLEAANVVPNRPF